MAKWGKKLLGLAAIGGAAAGLVYYLKSKEELDLDDFDDDFDDDFFDDDDDDEEEAPAEQPAETAEAPAAEPVADAE